MIDTLRRKMIGICAALVTAVFLLIFGLICGVSMRQLNQAMDLLTDRIVDGAFVPFNHEQPRPVGIHRFPDFINDETPFSTRFFEVRLTEDKTVIEENIASIASVSREDARNYAYEALEKNRERGWIENYRYKMAYSENSIQIVFVDGSMNRNMTKMLLITSGSILTGSAVMILILLILFSKRAVKPIAESYEKQKQFVTDANHELKTPLTLILTNLEIVQSEIGPNEWLADIQAEGQRMSALVNQLTALSRLDEDQPRLTRTDFSLSEVVTDTVSEFQQLSAAKNLKMQTDIQVGIRYCGDEGNIRRVVSILMDNAMKYCDPKGEISVSLTVRRHPQLCVENSCANVDAIELKRVFDRFYRADKARTAGNSFGIGLSLAKAIVDRHHGEIRAYKAGEGRIGFQVIFK